MDANRRHSRGAVLITVVGIFLVMSILIGAVLDKTGGYLVPMLIFSSFGVLAFFFTFLLKLEDKKKGYGLELPEVK